MAEKQITGKIRRPLEAPAKSKEETLAEPAFHAGCLDEDTELLGDFVSEAMEHLEAADVQLLTLETEPKDEEALNAVFRAFHTIKGVAGFLGLQQIGQVAHEAENLLDLARRGELALGGSAMDAAFDAVDALKRLVSGLGQALNEGQAPAKDESLPELIEHIKAVVSGEAKAEQPAPHVVAGARGKKLGEILVESGSVTHKAVNEALAEQQTAPTRPKLGEHLVRKGRARAKTVARALRAQKAASARRVGEAMKVDAGRLDRLVDAIRELVVVESMVSRSIGAGGGNGASAQLARRLARLDEITRQLYEMGISLQTAPLRPMFRKMARLVRDLAGKSGKPVEFVMSGEDTELGRTVVDTIRDPLVHMLRNAVDHGIEADPTERRKAGKREIGRVELRAFHKNGGICVEIEDDGRGLDREAILGKARERGIIQGGSSMSDREVWNLIFQAGFSTAKKVTDVSGRGVGMDVVRRNIEALHGQLDIRSQPGKGATFTIRLPLGRGSGLKL